MSTNDRSTQTAALPISLAEIAHAAVEAHKRASSVLAEPAASQAAGEAIRELIERYQAQ